MQHSLFKYQTFKNHFLWQTLILIILTLMLMLLFNPIAALSGLLGGLTALIPSLIFRTIYFKKVESLIAKKVVTRFYWAEIMKIFTTILLFTGIFQWGKLEVVPMFLIFIFMQLVCLLKM